MSEDVLKISDHDRVRLLTLNRPDRRNALSRALKNAIMRAIIAADFDAGVSVVAITGAGTSFCAGADLKDAREADEDGGRYRGPLAEPERSLFELMSDSKKPLMAIMNGPAVAGGCELALSCDLRIAADTAFMQLPEAKRGMGAHMASVMLPQMVPPAIAMEWLYTGRKIIARRGRALGAVEPRGAGRQADGHRDGDGARHRRKRAAVAATYEADVPQGVGDAAACRHAPRRRPGRLRVGGPQGRRACVPGEACAEVAREVAGMAGPASILQALKPLFEPASVAIVGASGTPGKYGNTVVRYLKNAGFAGRIYPINPDGGHHEGLQFYTSLADVPERIDCAFTVIPAAATPAAVRAGAAAGVRAMIIGASGFAEMGSEAGRQRQAEIVAAARAAGMIVLGPNTNGIWNAHHGLALGFNTSHGEPMPRGPISIAAHSGALFDSFIPRLAAFGGGFAKLVPLGNEATLDMLEVMDALIEDPQTEVIGLIMEAIGDGARLMALARKAHAAGKPVFVLKLARSAAGRTAAIAHSSRLAGSTRAYDALFREAGIVVVRSIETLAAVCTLASDKRALALAGDTRLIGVSGSGGGCSLMADHAAERGIALAGDEHDRGTWTGRDATRDRELRRDRADPQSDRRRQPARLRQAARAARRDGTRWTGRTRRRLRASPADADR